jgi:hypothetical protein
VFPSQSLVERFDGITKIQFGIAGAKAFEKLQLVKEPERRGNVYTAASTCKRGGNDRKQLDEEAARTK